MVYPAHNDTPWIFWCLALLRDFDMLIYCKLGQHQIRIGLDITLMFYESGILLDSANDRDGQLAGLPQLGHLRGQNIAFALSHYETWKRSCS